MVLPLLLIDTVATEVTQYRGHFSHLVSAKISALKGFLI